MAKEVGELMALKSASQHSLLKFVLERHLAEQAPALLAREPEDWNPVDRDRVREAIGEELAESGFDADWEPTQRGRDLEALIDLMNRLNARDLGAT